MRPSGHGKGAPSAAPRLTFALLAGLTACTEPSAEAVGIERERFVAVYIDLRDAMVDGAADSAGRDSVLAAHGVTRDELRAYVDAYADDPAALAETWREIMDSVAARDTTRTTDDSTRAET